MFNNNKMKLSLSLSIAAHALCALLIVFKVSQSLNTNANDPLLMDVVLYQSTEKIVPATQSAITKPSNFQKSNGDVVNNPVENSQTVDNASIAENAPTSLSKGRLAITAEEMYIAELKNSLDKLKKYPVLAKKMGHTGKVKIKFEIDRNGQIIRSEITEHSSHDSLNQSVKNLLNEVKKFKPFPDEIKHVTWQFTLPVEFKL